MKPLDLYRKYAFETANHDYDVPFGPSTQNGALGGAALGAFLGVKNRTGPVRAGLAGGAIGALVPIVMNADLGIEHIRRQFQ